MNSFFRNTALSALRRSGLLTSLTQYDFTYKIINGQVIITEFSHSYSGHLDIPAVLEGYPVTALGWGAFKNCSLLTSVNIPASVSSIESKAFFGCTSLTSVKIPESVTFFGKDVFKGCSSLPTDEHGIQYESLEKKVLIKAPYSLAKEFTIPDSVKFVHCSAFANCSSLTSVEIPSSVTSIGDRAFVDCSSLTSVTIPKGVSSIGLYAFSGCSSLTSVVILSNIIDIDYGAFWHCNSLRLLEIPSSIITKCDDVFIDGAPEELVAPRIPNKMGTKNLTSVRIPADVTSIESSAFSGCNSLKSVVIPEGVTSIGESAFSNCSSLTDVTIPASVTAIGKLAFDRCSALVIKVSPNNASYVAVDGCLFNKDCTVLLAAPGIKGNYNIPEGVTSIDDRAFFGCSLLTSVKIPASVTKIGKLVFAGCSALAIKVNPNNASYASVDGCLFNKDGTVLLAAPSIKGDYNIPEGVTFIGEGAFFKCSSLTSVIISRGVTAIGDRAFADCSSLASVKVPTSVTKIGIFAFAGSLVSGERGRMIDGYWCFLCSKKNRSVY